MVVIPQGGTPNGPPTAGRRCSRVRQVQFELGDRTLEHVREFCLESLLAHPVGRSGDEDGASERFVRIADRDADGHKPFRVLLARDGEAVALDGLQFRLEFAPVRYRVLGAGR